MRRLLGIITVAAALALAAPVGADNSCGAGPSLEAHAVSGGVEVTYLPPESYRLRVRAAKDLKRHGQHTSSVEVSPSDAPLFIAAPAGKPVLQLLVYARGRAGEPYPRLGCPTSQIVTH